mmetsp:Transcript_30317/g.50090  ORF Transcript_30317/g.50090 Transcript_30317/m.50090 type:complete len:168 (+) Transcript_30317:37-540(+)
MANAAAKKSAAARASAGQSYRPLFLGINAVYLVMKLGFSPTADYTIWSYLGMCFLLGLNWLCYTSILDSASTSTTASTSSKDLPGGAWLDVVALVWLVQAVTTFWTSSTYYLLLVLPPLGAYKIYRTFQSPGGTYSQNENNSGEQDVSEEVQQRRQKRSDRRRQKRS